MRGIRARVLEEVQRCPATSADIADALGMPMHNASATLSYLYRLGVLDRRVVPKPGRGPKPHLYSIRGTPA